MKPETINAVSRRVFQAYELAALIAMLATHEDRALAEHIRPVAEVLSDTLYDIGGDIDGLLQIGADDTGGDHGQE